MKCLWFLLAGLLGGVLAGMGMGGGTLTIPLLVLALGVDQLTAQFANLAAFLPTGAASLVVHVKNGLVDTKGLAAFIIPAVAATAVTAAFAHDASDILGKLFGGFLVAVAVASLVAAVVKTAKS